MLTLLLSFVPDSALVLVIAGVGVAVIIGFVRPRTAFGFIGSLALIVMAAPFVEALFAALPLWFGACVILGAGFWIVRVLLESTLGRHAAGHVIGTAFVGAMKILFAILLLPVRVIARLLFGR